jgi:hypothetical protein
VVLGFIEHLQFVTTTNYSDIANYTLYNSLQQALSVLSLLCLRRLSPGNGFQRRRTLNFCVHVLTDSRRGH